MAACSLSNVSQDWEKFYNWYVNCVQVKQPVGTATTAILP